MDTSHFMRHVGKMANTDQRIVVAFMQIREKPDHALIIPVDNLPPRFEQAIMDVLKTPEGQAPGPFAMVLHRHRMPDTGETIMEALHRLGKFVAVPVSKVVMLPTPNMPVPLASILEQQGLLQQQQMDESFETNKFNPHVANMQAETSENSRAISRTLLMEAEDLEAIARQKRSQAYEKDPSMRPNLDTVLKQQVQPMPVPQMTMQKKIEPVVEPNPLEGRLDKLEAMLEKLLPVDALNTEEPKSLTEPSNEVA